MAPLAIAGFFILAVACGVGFGVASADSSDDLARAGAFGFSEETHAATLEGATGEISVHSDSVEYDQQALATASSRDISAGLEMVDELEEAEKARIEADNIAVIKRVEAEKAKQGVVSATSSAYVAPAEDSEDSEEVQVQPTPPAEGATEYNLPAVDWSCGKEAFMEEWTARIDAYLEGSVLEGYGSVFAEAAWDNGVDPRWSPAISNTESGKGKACFLPYNAWGWGSSGWSDWETAIRDHVEGLATVYGYSITTSAAYVYCPPTYMEWYNATISEMALI